MSFPSFSTVNFYAGNKLNRLSWLRSNTDFVNGAISSPSTRFLALKNLNPLVHKGGDHDGLLATLSWDQVKSTVIESISLAGGREDVEKNKVFGPQRLGLASPGATDEGKVKEFKKHTDGLGPPNLALVFLGVDETETSGSSMPGELIKGDASSPAGIPYFALSLTYRPPTTPVEQKLPTQQLLEKLEESGDYDFVDTRALAKAGLWETHHAALVAQARSLIDWNERNVFCPACSRRQYSLWAGYKRGCSSALSESATNSAFAIGNGFGGQGGLPTPDCPSTKLLSNFSYPRTDPVIIMGVLSPDGEKILLGRQKTWPKGFYSCLAGFVEPGESLEEAVRREIHEESGVGVGRVIYHSSQPWPFPANLMVGAFGEAIEGKDKIRLDLDNELEDARFFTREEVLSVLDASGLTTLTKEDLAKMDENVKAQQEAEKQGKEWDKKDDGSVANAEQGQQKDAAFRIPGPTAIASILIQSWARKQAYLPPASTASPSSTTKGKM